MFDSSLNGSGVFSATMHSIERFYTIQFDFISENVIIYIFYSGNCELWIGFEFSFDFFLIFPSVVVVKSYYEIGFSRTYWNSFKREYSHGSNENYLNAFRFSQHSTLDIS